jgi:hypothetical protein
MARRYKPEMTAALTTAIWDLRENLPLILEVMGTPERQPDLYQVFVGTVACWFVRAGENPARDFAQAADIVSRFASALAGCDATLGDPPVCLDEAVGRLLPEPDPTRRSVLYAAAAKEPEYSLPWCLAQHNIKEAVVQAAKNDPDSFVHIASAYVRRSLDDMDKGVNKVAFLVDIASEKSEGCRKLHSSGAIIRLLSSCCRLLPQECGDFQRLIQIGLLRLDPDMMCRLRHEIASFAGAFGRSAFGFPDVLSFLLRLPSLVREFPPLIRKLKRPEGTGRITHMLQGHVTIEEIAKEWFTAISTFPTGKEYEDEDNKFHREMATALQGYDLESRIDRLKSLFELLWNSFHERGMGSPANYIRCAVQLQQVGLEQRVKYEFTKPADFLIVAEQVLSSDARVAQNATQFFRIAYPIEGGSLGSVRIPEARAFPSERIRAFYALFMNLFSFSLQAQGETEAIRTHIKAERDKFIGDLMREASGDRSRLSNCLIACCLFETRLPFTEKSFLQFCSQPPDLTLSTSFAIGAITARCLCDLPGFIRHVVTKGTDGLVGVALKRLFVPPPIPRRGAHDLHAHRLITRVYLDLIILGKDSVGHQGPDATDPEPVTEDHTFCFLRELVQSCVSMSVDLEIRAKVFLCILLLGARSARGSATEDQMEAFGRDIERLSELLRTLTSSPVPVAVGRHTNRLGRAVVTNDTAIRVVRDWIIAFAGDLAGLDRPGLGRICLEIEYARRRRPAQWSSAVFGGLLVCLAAQGSLTSVRIELFRHADVRLWDLVTDIFVGFEGRQDSPEAVLPLVSVFGRFVTDQNMQVIGTRMTPIFRAIVKMPPTKWSLNTLSAMVERFPPGQPDNECADGYFRSIQEFALSGLKTNHVTRDIINGVATIVRTRGQGMFEQSLIIPILQQVLEKPGKDAPAMAVFRMYWTEAQGDDQVRSKVVAHVAGNFNRAFKDQVKNLMRNPEKLSARQLVWLCAFAQVMRDASLTNDVREVCITILDNPKHDCYMTAVDALKRYV